MIIYVIVLFAFANELFNLVPQEVRFEDFGLILIFAGLTYCLVFRRHNLAVLSNFLTWYTFAYLLLVAVQASLVSFYYQQSVIDGLVASREQFYYLAFPLFLLLIEDRRSVDNVMRALTLCALCLFFLALVNYFGTTIFHHKWAEGQGERSGIERAFIPGMNILVIATAWQAWKHVSLDRLVSVSLVLFFILFSALIFRQTKGHIVSVAVALLLMLTIRRRIGLLLAIGCGVVGASIVVSMYTSENMLLAMFKGGYEDVTQNAGTWGNRIGQVQESWALFVETFWTGSGGLAVREVGGVISDLDLHNLNRNKDLGYWVWVKFYGFPGLLLLGVLLIGYVKVSGSAVRRTSGYANHLVVFGILYMVVVMVSMVTLPYFTQPSGILPLCLAWAIQVRASKPGSFEVWNPAQGSREREPLLYRGA